MKSTPPSLPRLKRSIIAVALSRPLTTRASAARARLPSAGNFSTKQLWTELDRLSRWRNHSECNHKDTKAQRKPASKKYHLPAFFVPLCLCVFVVTLIQAHQFGRI